MTKRKQVLCSSDSKLPPAEILRRIFKDMLAVTYPTKTLKRRIESLTKRERASCDKIYAVIVRMCEEIEEVISNRADMKQDKWP